MIKRLYIKDFAIVEELDIEFSSGFIVITGETGAGKSILVGALGLLCGDRGQSDLVRAGASKAILEAEFYFQPDGKIEHLLDTHQLEIIDTRIIIRREINEKGLSRGFINDTPVNMTVLQNITSVLIDLHGQHQHQRLIHPENHLNYLDSFGSLKSRVEAFQNANRGYQEQLKLLRDYIDRRKDSLEKHDLYNFQVNELDAAKLSEEELDLLIRERKILENNEALFEVANQAGSFLYSEEDSASNKIAEVIRKMKPMADIDPSFMELVQNLKSAQVSVEESGRQCETYATKLDFNPERLEEIQKRESELTWLLKKYQVDGIKKLVLRREEMKGQLRDLGNYDEKIEQLEKSLEDKRKLIQQIAIELSDERRRSAKNFENKLESVLSSVGLNNARFEVQVDWHEKKDGLIHLNGNNYDINDDGMDIVSFNVGLNLGEPVRPLHKVASGGEVSRIMLSIKSIMADADALDTLIFDEIDSGISGRFAEIVGKKMQEISRHHQLLVITHLPQIAAQGDSHFSVIKEEKDGRTQVKVQKLDTESRIIELAKLLGGENVTPQAEANARALLEELS
jgi:DNA repair protein RecN (Recombination protein N)